MPELRPERQKEVGETEGGEERTFQAEAGS